MSSLRNFTRLLGIGAGALGAYYLAQYAQRTAPLGKTRVIAHRGGPKYAPENTLAAFTHAIAVGADMLECDVHLSKDNVPVIIHDETLERTTNGTGWVMDKTYAELRQLNAGNGEPIPALAEIIALGKKSGVELLIELKSPELYPGIEEHVLADLEAADYLDHSVLQSFEWDCLRRLRQLKPTARLGALYYKDFFDVSWPPADAEYVCLMAEAVLVNPGLVRQAHNEGRGVFVWFNQTESPLTYRFLRAFGVDGLIADDPVQAREALIEA
jgi:glycerophosphoryl diester phosphodiesterase